MLDELWIQLLAGFVLAFGTFFTWALSRYRDRRAREKETRFWYSHAREWSELAGSYRRLIANRVIEDSDIDEHTRKIFDNLEVDYDRLIAEYKAGLLNNNKKVSINST